MSKTRQAPPGDRSANTVQAATKFRKDVKAFTDRATSSPEKARKTLVELGTHTKAGRLTKRFGG